MNEYATSFGNSAADALPAQRAQFIRKTYLLLAAAILAFVVIETLLFASGIAQSIVSIRFFAGSWSWLIILGIFMVVSYIAQNWAMSDTSKGLQYLGLGIGVLAYALIFVFMINFAVTMTGDLFVLAKAGIVTLGLFLGITATVFITKTDFSFLGPIVAIGTCIAFGLILSGALFGFSLGSLFAFVMVAVAGTAILYETSNVLHRFNTDQHVAASLTLFASIALLFWYILSIFSSRD